ncbi:MAG TPA: DinB family protein [Gemmatimonadaceae bacterium]|jgi:hypothetical protein|nr:DinB family protein [Gemmatimonadaceae bacterium]
MTTPEPWLRGPIPGIASELQPVAHALSQAREDLPLAAGPLTLDELWVRPGGAASVGYHVRHLAGSLDRLFGYARGESLSREQLAALRAEGEPGDPPADAATLLAGAEDAIARAVAQLAATPPESLGDERLVGRAALPSTVRGLLFHAAEHTQRHVGQVITTAKIVRGLRLGSPTA